MTNAPEPDTLTADDLQTLWQDEPVEISPMILADVHKRAIRFDTLQRLAIITMAVCTLFGFAMAGFVMMHRADGLFSIGVSLLALGVLFNLYYLHTYRLTNRQALAGVRRACLDFYRGALQHKIKLVRTWWAWSLLPMLPGALLVLYRLEQLLDAPGSGHNPKATITLAQAKLILHGEEIFFVVFLLVFAVIQLVRTRRLKRELLSLPGS